MELSTSNILKQGAEARLFKGEYFGKPVVVKERFKKSYRHDHLDEHILKERTKAEVRGLLRSKAAGVNTPAVFFADLDSRKIYIEFISGITVKDYIEDLLTNSTSNSDELQLLTSKIGLSIGNIHKSNLIHGDLTTSNMLVDETKTTLFLIDFGLSYVSTSAEDKGVDLYVLERALISTHACPDDIFKQINASYLKAYPSGAKEVLKKYEEVKARGRKRTMVG